MMIIKWLPWHGDGISGYHGVEVELLHVPAAPDRAAAQLDEDVFTPTTTPIEPGMTLTVRVEEVVLVSLVLLLWVGAIALFFNRWGKIRMLEPYQPKYHCEDPSTTPPLTSTAPPVGGVTATPLHHHIHRPSCPLMGGSPPMTRTGAKLQRMSFSKYNVNALTDPLSILPSPIIKRQRRQSVFVGHEMTMNEAVRRAKSATDISVTGRRSSLITIEKQQPIVLCRVRRSSMFVPRPTPNNGPIQSNTTTSKLERCQNVISGSVPNPRITFEGGVVGTPPRVSRSFEHPPQGGGGRSLDRVEELKSTEPLLQ